MDDTLWAQADAVVFDAFGTLVEIRDKRMPIKKLLALAESNASRALGQRLMCEEWSWTDMIESLGLYNHQCVPALTRDLDAELASVAPRPEALAFWPLIAQSGKATAVCSNLATPYIAPCIKALPGPTTAHIWSSVVGATKPDPAIYRATAKALGVEPARILFIGDRKVEDQDGPHAAGMMAASVADFAQWARILQPAG